MPHKINFRTLSTVDDLVIIVFVEEDPVASLFLGLLLLLLLLLLQVGPDFSVLDLFWGCCVDRLLGDGGGLALGGAEDVARQVREHFVVVDEDGSREGGSRQQWVLLPQYV